MKENSVPVTQTSWSHTPVIEGQTPVVNKGSFDFTILGEFFKSNSLFLTVLGLCYSGFSLVAGGKGHL